MITNVNNINLNYEVEGNGDPLLLLHGNGEDLHIFDKLRNKLKNHFTVYAIDSRNHGLSTYTDDYSYNTFANDIYLFIQKLNLKDVSLLGFSDGAIIGTLLAIQYPKLFKQMVLLGLNINPQDFTPEAYEYLKEEFEKTKNPLILLMLQEPNIALGELEKIQTPTLIIAAENDIFTKESFDRIHKAIKESTYITIAGHDHSSYIVGEDLLYKDLKQFLL